MNMILKNLIFSFVFSLSSGEVSTNMLKRRSIGFKLNGVFQNFVRRFFVQTSENNSIDLNCDLNLKKKLQKFLVPVSPDIMQYLYPLLTKS